MQIGKAVLCFIHNPVFPADICKNFHKPVIMWTWKFIRIAISSDIPLPQSREMFIQSLVKIFPVAIPHCNSHAKADNPFHTGSNTVIKNSVYIFFRIINKRQNRRQPHNRRDSCFFKLHKCPKPLSCRCNIWLYPFT